MLTADAPFAGPLTFEVGQGIGLWLCRKNRFGKVEPVRADSRGGHSFYGRSARRGSNLKISYVPQDASFCRASCPAMHAYAKSTSLFKAILRKAWLFAVQFEKRYGTVQRGPEEKCCWRKVYVNGRISTFGTSRSIILIFFADAAQTFAFRFGLTLIFVEHDQTFSSQNRDKDNSFVTKL